MTARETGIGASGGSCWGKRKPGRGAVLATLAVLAGCGTVRPSGPEVVAELGRGPALAQYLVERGFAPLGQVAGGPRPGNVPQAVCHEKARGGAVGGVDVVRVCFNPDGTPRAIYTMQTHGLRWQEIWPRDVMVDTLNGGVAP